MTGQNQNVKMSVRDLRQLARFRAMAEAHLERLGRAIRARREKLGWSRNELGRKVSAHEKTVERWEKALTAGACDNLESIAEALGCDVDELLEEAKAEQRPDHAPGLMAELVDQVASLQERVGVLAAQVGADEIRKKHEPGSLPSEEGRDSDGDQ